MNFLGMGPMELMVILVMALVIFGPGKLPEIAGQVGRVVRDFRRMTGDLSSEFNRTLSLEIEERKSTQSGTVAPPAPVESTDTNAAPAAESTAPPVPAYEPSEAPAPVAVAEAPPVPTFAPEPAAPVSRRRTIDTDLAPPY